MQNPLRPLAVVLLSSVLLLTACGPEVPKTALPAAAEKGDLRTVEKHIKAHSDLNAQNRAGWGATHYAAARGDLTILKALATAGADLNRAGPAGKTPLDLAREKGRIEVAKFLIDATKARPGGGGRGLVDGGLGVSAVLDNQ